MTATPHRYRLVLRLSAGALTEREFASTASTIEGAREAFRQWLDSQPRGRLVEIVSVERIEGEDA